MNKTTKISLETIVRSYKGADTIDPGVSEALTKDILDTLNLKGKTIKLSEYIYHLLRGQKFRHRVLSSPEVSRDVCSNLVKEFEKYNVDVEDDLEIPQDIQDRIKIDDAQQLKEQQRQQRKLKEKQELVVEEPVVEEPVVEEVVEEPVVEEVVEEPVVEEKKDENFLSSLFEKKKTEKPKTKKTKKRGYVKRS